MARLVAATILSLFLLTGCIGSGGIKPRAHIIDAATLDPGAALKATQTDARWPAPDWWQHWHDPQLDALMQQALIGSPSLRIAQARLDFANAQARIAGASALPQLTAEGDFGRQRFPRYATPSPPGGYTVWSNSIALGLAYDLDVWGKNRAVIESALSAVQATAADTRSIQLALEAAVVRSYIQLSLQFALHDVYQTIQQQQQKTRDIVAQRVQAGLASQLELSQAETQLASSANQLERAEQAIELIRHQLAALTGQGPGAGDGIGRPALSLDLPIVLPSSLPVELIGHRPDVVAQRWRVESAAKGIAAAHADFYPNIDLLATADLTSATTFGGFFNFMNNAAAGHRFGVAISLPIFDGGRLRGRYGTAVADYDSAVEAYNQSIIGALQAVADQLTSLKSLANQQASAEQAEASASRSYRLADQGYRSGVTEFLNVLAAQTDLLRQQQQLALIHAQRMDAWVLLMQALGGGMESAPVENQRITPPEVTSSSGGPDHAP
ncbi:MAG: efflux transporter outer membrane subunit [Rhodanobacter sp.]